ncbi:MAG: hypothetical protein IPL32_17985 [Chloracidobacterium sp.]|nr:hypothetical protein [Chloracidobacterium sp.]
MPISIPSSAQTAFQGNMNESGKIELPFHAPAFYIINGDAKLAALKNFQYYGGWACGTDKVKAAAESWENCPFPIPGYGTDNLPQTNGSEMEVVSSRKLIIAPIGMREYSSLFDQSTGNTRRVPPFTKGARPGIQVLSVLAYKNENAIHPWAPVLLTAKGYQTNHVKNAIMNWRKAIKPHVQKLVPGANDSILNLFWMHIGTFGDVRKQEIVGAGANQKTITPITAFIPDDITEQQVEKQYVGEPMAEFMADLSAQAQEWLNVFKQPQSATPVAGHIELEDDYSAPPPPEDDIPF